MSKGFDMLRKANPNAKSNKKSAEASKKFTKKLKDNEKEQVARNLSKSVVFTEPTPKVNYTQSQFKGKSEGDKTYKWETEHLKELPIKKYGRSYKDKFKSWAKEQGVEEGQLSEFRRWLDAREEEVEETSKKSMDLFGSQIRTGKQKRQNFADAVEWEDGDPKFSEETGKGKVLSKINKKINDSALFQAGKGAIDTIGAAINPFDDKKIGDSMVEAVNKMSDTPTVNSKAFKGTDRAMSRTLDSVSLGLMGEGTKALTGREPEYRSQREFGEGGGIDMISTGLGYLVPGMAAYKGLNATRTGKALTDLGSKGLGQRLVSEAGKGAAIGLGMGGVEVGGREILNPEDYTAKDNLTKLALDTTIGAVADPMLYGLGKGVRGGLNVLADAKNVRSGAYDNIRLNLNNNGATPSASTIDAITPKPTPNVLQEGDFLANTRSLVDSYVTGEGIIRGAADDSVKKYLQVAKQNRNISGVLDRNVKQQKTIEVARRNLEDNFMNERNKAIEEHFKFLQQTGFQGVNQGQIVMNDMGEVVDRVGRISNNPTWYQELYRELGDRQPTKKALRELAAKHVDEGYSENGENIPAWKPGVLQQLESAISQMAERIRMSPQDTQRLLPIMEQMETDHAELLNAYSSTLRVKAAPKVPEEVQQIDNSIDQLAQRMQQEPHKTTEILPLLQQLEERKSMLLQQNGLRIAEDGVIERVPKQPIVPPARAQQTVTPSEVAPSVRQVQQEMPAVQQAMPPVQEAPVIQQEVPTARVETAPVQERQFETAEEWRAKHGYGDSEQAKQVRAELDTKRAADNLEKEAQRLLKEQKALQKEIDDFKANPGTKDKTELEAKVNDYNQRQKEYDAKKSTPTKAATQEQRLAEVNKRHSEVDVLRKNLESKERAYKKYPTDKKKAELDTLTEAYQKEVTEYRQLHKEYEQDFLVSKEKNTTPVSVKVDNLDTHRQQAKTLKDKIADAKAKGKNPSEIANYERTLERIMKKIGDGPTEPAPKVEVVEVDHKPNANIKDATYSQLVAKVKKVNTSIKRKRTAIAKGNPTDAATKKHERELETLITGKNRLVREMQEIEEGFKDKTSQFDKLASPKKKAAPKKEEVPSKTDEKIEKTKADVHEILNKNKVNGLRTAPSGKKLKTEAELKAEIEEGTKKSTSPVKREIPNDPKEAKLVKELQDLDDLLHFDKQVLEMLKKKKRDTTTRIADIERTEKLIVETEKQLEAYRKQKDIQAMKSPTMPFREIDASREFKEDMSLMERLKNNLKRKKGKESVEAPITRKELLRSVSDAFGIPIYRGRLGRVDSSVKGFFQVTPEVIRTRNYGDVQVIAHEVGHFLDKKHNMLDQIGKQYDTELMKLGAKTSGPNYTDMQIRAEGIAEYIRLAFTDPNSALKGAPGFSKYFDSVLTPKMKKAFDNVSYDIGRWIDQGAELQLDGHIDRTPTKKSSGKTVYSSLVDKGDALKKVDLEYNYKEEKTRLGKTRRVLKSAEESLYKTYRNSHGAARIAREHLRGLEKILADVNSSGFSLGQVERYATAKRSYDMEFNGLRIADEMEEGSNYLIQTIKELQSRTGDRAVAPEVIEGRVDDFIKEYKIELDNFQREGLFNGKPLELTKEQREQLVEIHRIESGFTQEQILTTVGKYEDNEKINSLQQQLVSYNDELLQMLRKEGFIHSDAYDSAKKKHPNYIPFFRSFDEYGTVSDFGDSKGYVDLLNPVKAMRGGDLDIKSPIENMIKNTFSIITAIEKNKVGKQLLKLSDIEGIGKHITKVDSGGKSPKENIVTVWDKGERVPLQLSKEMYSAIKQLDVDSTNNFLNWIAKPTGWLRAGATLTPEFMLRNPIRDNLQAAVVSQHGYNPLKDFANGWYHVIKGRKGKSEIYDSWIKEGGAYGSYLSQDREYLKEVLENIQSKSFKDKAYQTVTTKQHAKRLFTGIVEKLQDLSEISEEAVKVGEFNNILKNNVKRAKKGKEIISRKEAAYQSRDLMDFARVGSDLKNVNRVVAFLNANIQGKDKIIRAFKQDFVGTTIKGITTLSVPTIGLAVANHYIANDKQREIMNNTEDWMKDTFWLVAIPGTDQVARLPKPFDLSPVFVNTVEYAIKQIQENEPEAWTDFVTRQAKILSDFPKMITSLEPFMENATNYDFFTERAIVPDNELSLEPWAQYGPTTSLTAQALGRAFNYSPRKIDNLNSGLFAGLGDYAVSILDKGLELTPLGDDLPTQPKKKISDYPLAKAFTVSDSGGGKVMNDFYKELDKHKTKSSMASRNEEDYDQEDKFKTLREASSEISELRKEYKVVQNSKTLEPLAKREQMDDLNERMKRIAKSTLQEVK